MKKLFALILALAMIFALGACGEQDVKGSVTTEAPAEATEEPAEATEEPAEATEAPAEATEEPAEATEAPAEATEAPAEATEEPAEATEAPAETGSRYENETLGIGVLLDDEWYIYNDEELAQLSGATADMFSDEKYQEMMENAKVFTDFFAQHSSGASINVTFENLGLLYGAALDEEQYRELAIQNVEPMYTSAGFTDITVEKNTVNFAGAERVGILSSCKVNGTDYFVQQVILKAGNHMAVISLCCFVQNDTAYLADLFYTLP